MRMLFKTVRKYRREALQYAGASIVAGGVPFAALAYFGGDYHLVFTAFVFGSLFALIGGALVAAGVMGLSYITSSGSLPNDTHEELAEIFA